jgi:hypothetical protein
MVTTFHHPGSDHRGVLYSWSAQAPFTEDPPSHHYHTGSLSSRRSESIIGPSSRNMWKTTSKAPYAFPKWNKAKRLLSREMGQNLCVEYGPPPLVAQIL